MRQLATGVAARFAGMTDHAPRNLRMTERIGATPVRYPFSFVIAGDSGAWPDPTADAIFAQLLKQTAALRPAPVFFANLGDFAGPGALERHRHYLELASTLEMPYVCLIGNHDLEAAAWSAVHGARNFQFAYGSTQFVAIDGASGQTGELGDTTPPDTAGRASRRSHTSTATTRPTANAGSARARPSSSTSSAATASGSRAAPMALASTTMSITASGSSCLAAVGRRCT